MPKHAVAYSKPKPGRIRPKPQVPKRLSAREFRQKAEALAERMIDLLNAFDGDENLEDGADHEPSLAGGYEKGGHAYDAELDESDKENSLGWTNTINQGRISKEEGLVGPVIENDGSF